jgi:predicted NBD/HSP70 family sugar kinase
MNTPVMDVGGTHVTAALADTFRWRTVKGTRQRTPLRSGGTAAEIVATFVSAVQPLGDIRASILGVSMPGPFDYDTGIGRFRGVGKFEALNGVDVGSALRAALPMPPTGIAFVNDASAFAIGEWIGGAAQGVRRVVGITLGTGVGSAFLDRGQVISHGPDVPPNGHAYLLRINGRPLEDVISRRAIIAAYQAAASQSGATCPPAVDVDTVARRAADADAIAQSVLDRAIGALGEALRPWLVRFAADILVVGGGITASWKLIEPALRDSLFGVGTRSEPAWHGGTIVRSADPEESILAGAAWHAVNSQTEISLNRST